MAELILGPLLRYVGEREATVWVETDAPCEVEVLGHRARTFHVFGHHYAVVAIEGLSPGESVEYGVALDGERRWPDPSPGVPGDDLATDGPAQPSCIRTLDPEHGLRIAFGSCRVAAPHEEPWVRERREHEHGRGVDALVALARKLQGQPGDTWPSLLLMVGDQVYADDASPETRAFIRARRSTSKPPGEGVADFEEYTRLYLESWSEPTIRWLLSTVPSAMIFDDHEVVDDWNISESWRREMTAQPWWDERIAGAFMSYWLYQHLGNLSPDELRANDLYVLAQREEDAGPLLKEFALGIDRGSAGTRWSYSRRLGGSLLVVVDSRAGRVVHGGRREMLDDAEWNWLEQRLHGDVDHLLIATSLPFLLPPAIHHLEAWNEGVCAGAWGARAARAGERLRRAIDLEHWAAFRSSFERFTGPLRAVAAGERGAPPASIVFLSGDVHYSYLAEASLGGDGATRVYQAVCSPFRHSLDLKLQLASRIACHRVTALGTKLLRSAARVPKPPIHWRLRRGPFFENDVATLTLEGRSARLKLENTPRRQLRLEHCLESRLT